jgi:hypothetical protein
MPGIRKGGNGCKAFRILCACGFLVLTISERIFVFVFPWSEIIFQNKAGYCPWMFLPGALQSKFPSSRLQSIGEM